MRITLDIDEHLVREAERLAAERDTTLSAIVEDALRMLLRDEDLPLRKR